MTTEKEPTDDDMLPLWLAIPLLVVIVCLVLYVLANGVYAR